MNALGDALLEAWGGRARLRSYTAKGWHAQVTKLTESQRGYNALADAGVSVTPRTLMGWLSESQEPSKANRTAIARAYDRMAGGWDPANERRDYRITGTVKIGRDVRERGARGRAPLLVDGRQGDWESIREAWNAGELDSDQAEDLFVSDVIDNDPALSSSSDPFEFPGGSYTIT